MSGTRGSCRSWSPQELELLSAIYPREGIAGAMDALPARNKHAIEQKAHKLGLQSPVVADAPKLVLTGDRLEHAIALYEQGGKFEAIAREVGCTPTATTNAILIALCPRRGFRPAERDATGRLTPESKERLRYMLKKGLKAVDIVLRLGISAARVAEERRRYNADLAARGKALLPPPGNGEQYSGVKIPAATRRAAEAGFLDGNGAPTVARRVGISVPAAKHIRTRLIKRLARQGRVLPGCDRAGRRIGAAKTSVHFIPAESCVALRERLLAREPVARAAKALGIGSCSAYRIRDALASELAAQGKELPTPIRPGRWESGRAVVQEADWLPTGRLREFRHLVHEKGFEDAKRIILAAQEAERAAAAALIAAERARPKTFDEQLALIAAGKVQVVQKVALRRPDPTMTLGGIATAALA
jgi:hypothetical protein